MKNIASLILFIAVGLPGMLAFAAFAIFLLPHAGDYSGIVIVLLVLGIAAILLGIFFVRDSIKIFRFSREQRKLTKKDTVMLMAGALLGVLIFLGINFAMDNFS